MEYATSAKINLCRRTCFFMFATVTAAMTSKEPTINPWPHASNTSPSGSVGRNSGVSDIVELVGGSCRIQGSAINGPSICRLEVDWCADREWLLNYNIFHFLNVKYSM